MQMPSGCFGFDPMRVHVTGIAPCTWLLSHCNGLCLDLADWRAARVHLAPARRPWERPASAGHCGTRCCPSLRRISVPGGTISPRRLRTPLIETVSGLSQGSSVGLGCRPALAAVPPFHDQDGCNPPKRFNSRAKSGPRAGACLPWATDKYRYITVTG